MDDINLFFRSSSSDLVYLRVDTLVAGNYLLNFREENCDDHPLFILYSDPMHLCAGRRSIGASNGLCQLGLRPGIYPGSLTSQNISKEVAPKFTDVSRRFICEKIIPAGSLFDGKHPALTERSFPTKILRHALVRGKKVHDAFLRFLKDQP